MLRLSRFQSISRNIHHETKLISIFFRKHKIEVHNTFVSKHCTQTHPNTSVSACVHSTHFYHEYNLCSPIYHMHGMCFNQSESCARITKIIHRRHRHKLSIKRHPIGRDLKINVDVQFKLQRKRTISCK